MQQPWEAFWDLAAARLDCREEHLEGLWPDSVVTAAAAELAAAARAPVAAAAVAAREALVRFNGLSEMLVNTTQMAHPQARSLITFSCSSLA